MDSAGGERELLLRAMGEPMIAINRRIAIDEDEISFRFIRSPGPGGQNVNKVATAAQLSFDVRRSPNLPDEVKERLSGIAGRRISREGVLVITARRHRLREQNRQDALARLIALLQRAAAVPKKRIATQPSPASRAERAATKRKRSETKRRRSAGRREAEEVWREEEAE